MPRLNYWMSVLGMWIVFGVAFAFVDNGTGSADVFGRACAIVFLAVTAALSAFRLRDADRNEKWAILAFIPLLNVVAIIVIGVLPSRDPDFETRSYDNPF